jgi:hypothetical protein
MSGVVLANQSLLDVDYVKGPTMPLINNFDGIFEMDVHQTMHFNHYYGQDYDLQDLQWLQELLQNSCDKDLQNKIGKKLKEVPSNEHGWSLLLFDD